MEIMVWTNLDRHMHTHRYGNYGLEKSGQTHAYTDWKLWSGQIWTDTCIHIDMEIMVWTNLDRHMHTHRYGNYGLDKSGQAHAYT